MNTKHLVLLVGGCFVVAATVMSLQIPPDASTTRAVASARREWRVVQTWKGSGIKETETFSVASREWRIHWETRNEPFAGAGILQIYVHQEDGTLVSLAANKQGTGSDTSYVRSAGKHYLQINSANVDWVVTVEDQR